MTRLSAHQLSRPTRGVLRDRSRTAGADTHPGDDGHPLPGVRRCHARTSHERGAGFCAANCWRAAYPCAPPGGLLHSQPHEKGVQSWAQPRERRGPGRMRRCVGGNATWLSHRSLMENRVFSRLGLGGVSRRGNHTIGGMTNRTRPIIEQVYNPSYTDEKHTPTLGRLRQPWFGGVHPDLAFVRRDRCLYIRPVEFDPQCRSGGANCSRAWVETGRCE